MIACQDNSKLNRIRIFEIFNIQKPSLGSNAVPMGSASS